MSSACDIDNQGYKLCKKQVRSCGSTGPTDLEMAGGRQEGARRVAVPTEQITRKKERLPSTGSTTQLWVPYYYQYCTEHSRHGGQHNTKKTTGYTLFLTTPPSPRPIPNE